MTPLAEILTGMALFGNLGCAFHDVREVIDIFRQNKKRRHERYSCSCREASDANYFRKGGDGFDHLNRRNKYSIA
jgi:hypothetical protein